MSFSARPQPEPTGPVRGDLRREARAALAVACARTGLDAAQARLLRLRANAVFRLRAPVVVRLSRSPAAAQRMPQVLAVVRWLADQGFPTVRPLDEVSRQPVHVDGWTVTFWRYVPAGPDRPDAADLGGLLRTLHDLPPPATLPRRLDDPLRGVRDALATAPDVLHPGQRDWLTRRVAELSEAWAQLGFSGPPVLLHGDAWIDNVLRAEPGGSVLLDWDSTAVGPREWDLLPVVHGQRRFGLTTGDVDAFTTAYGQDLRTRLDFPILMAIRDCYAVGVHIRNATGDSFSAAELPRRLRALMSGDDRAQWQLRV